MSNILSVKGVTGLRLTTFLRLANESGLVKKGAKVKETDNAIEVSYIMGDRQYQDFWEALVKNGFDVSLYSA